MGIIFILMFSFFNSNADTYQPPEHVKVADVIQKEVGDRLEIRHKMNIVAQSAALFGKMNELGFRFQLKGPKSKEELWAILIDCAEELVNSVNQIEGITQYLDKYPFSFDKVDIIIFNEDENGRDIFHPLIIEAFLNKGILLYCTMEKGEMSYKTEENESYEEALRAIGRNI